MIDFRAQGYGGTVMMIYTSLKMTVFSIKQHFKISVLHWILKNLIGDGNEQGAIDRMIPLNKSDDTILEVQDRK